MLTNASERSWTSTTELSTAKQFISLHCWALASCSDFVYPCGQRPYCVESTRSHLNSEVKLHKARLVLGWGTAWEALRVLLTFLAKRNFQISRALLASINDERPDWVNIECQITVNSENGDDCATLAHIYENTKTKNSIKFRTQQVTILHVGKISAHELKQCPPCCLSCTQCFVKFKINFAAPWALNPKTLN